MGDGVRFDSTKNGHMPMVGLGLTHKTKNWTEFNQHVS